jgi:hypothetical protein
MTPRKGIKGGTTGSVEILSIDDDMWGRITAQLPDKLPEAIEAKLRERVRQCCSRYHTRRQVWLRDIVTAAAMRTERGKRAPFERLVDALQTAADVWDEITEVYYIHRLGGRPQPEGPDHAATIPPKAAAEFGGVFHDNRLGNVGRYAELREMARGARRQLEGVRNSDGTISVPGLCDLGEAVSVTNPWGDFVRDLRKDVEATPGLPPVTASGTAGYEVTANPSWFQKFVVAVEDNLVGGERRLSLNATYAAIAQALSETPSQG